MPDSLLNKSRPPVFCPGCSHEKVVYALNTAFMNMGLSGERIAIVSDIGCSGLFDTFFNTHAFHGLHGRALTYAAGLKLACPELTVVVTMGDGGLGIGGAHLLAACRRNLDITLLVLNNLNYGMTGGQCSPTTPQDAQVDSGFLNRLETPLAVTELAFCAGAGYVADCSSYQKNLPEELERAIRFEGFAVMDIRGICPGRYTRNNKRSPRSIDQEIACLPKQPPIRARAGRKEYGRHYRELSAAQKPAAPPIGVAIRHRPPSTIRQEIIILGDAGQRVLTAGEILCLAGMSAGLRVTQKNDYHITVLRGPSISEIVLSPDDIDYTGIVRPGVVIAIGQEGVNARRNLFAGLDAESLVVKAPGIQLPPHPGTDIPADFSKHGVKREDWALASLWVMARLEKAIHAEMLRSALSTRFHGEALESALALGGPDFWA
ncbi:MAG: thiamine pyrophosphate-dependent enzyme [Thermodesulfobacteriota bacterium]